MTITTFVRCEVYPPSFDGPVLEVNAVGVTTDNESQVRPVMSTFRRRELRLLEFRSNCDILFLIASTFARFQLLSSQRRT